MFDPARYNITIHQGATFLLWLRYKDNLGAYVDLSGYEIVATLWNRLGTEQIANFEFEWINQSEGAFQLSLSALVTGSIVEQGQYDVLMTQPGGRKFYLLEGTAFWNPGLSGRGYTNV